MSGTGGPTDRGNFMVARHGSLVAWRQPAHLDPHGGIRLVGAHTDSPNLRLKPHPDMADTTPGHWRQVAVETYGGVLWNSWLDRDLGIAGVVVVADGTDTRQVARADRRAMAAHPPTGHPSGSRRELRRVATGSAATPHPGVGRRHRPRHRGLLSPPLPDSTPGRWWPAS